ncbi:26S protease regulatory subunit [Halogeometricum sp. CBA1124]|uniref:ATP-binding protein n=1 Tax=Halogeometricum sp. CBA1124 TaxID=2668071 RepID=UPI00142BDACA|nr:ATP-binding protein [Halogeometricum sp. CBA1124]MUV56086.1 AAA family ATPase [Halogeometricum sp. CBA1124]
MTDLHRKGQLNNRFKRLQQKAKREEEAGNDQKALESYKEMAELLEQAAALLGTGNRERFLKKRVVQKIEELGGEVPDKVSVEDRAKRNSEDAQLEQADSIEEVQSEVFDIHKPNQSFEDVGGRDRVKKILKRKVILPVQEREKYEKYGLNVVNGVLFYGPTGTGKTYLAEALAGELDFTCITTSGAQLKNRFLGESEASVRELFRTAEQFQPCMIFIDEIDDVAKSRKKASTDGVAGMVNQFLDNMAEMKGEDVLVVGSTNYPEKLDTAVLSPHRFSEQIKIGIPPKKTRYAILDKMLERKPDQDVVNWNSIDLRTIAEETHGYSAADLENLIENAFYKAVRREEKVGQHHLRHGLQQTSPTKKVR